MVDPRFEPLLRAVITGEIERDAPRVRESALQDPEFARELAVHLSLVDALEREGVLARAKGLAPLPGEQGVVPFVRARLTRRSRAWLAALACAAALLLFVALRQLGGPDRPSPPEDFPLGPGIVTCVEPEGEVDDFARFRWDSNVRGGVFELRVLDQDGNELWHETLRGVREWSPAADLHSTWPSEIQWQIEWWDDSDVQHPGDTARARRRP